jgi:probable HAF family extracellular repeat protein
MLSQIRRTILVLAALPATAFAQSAEFIPLGTLPGGATPSSYAVAVSADGRVVVGGAESSNGNEAFRWAAGVMTGLGYIPGGGTFSEATGVSGDGTIIVGQSWNGTRFEAFRSVNGGTPQGLGGLVPSTNQNILSIGTGVSDNGSVIVGWSRAVTTGTPIEAFRHVGGVMFGLGDLAGGIQASVARAASADGSTIVGDASSANGNEAFAWTAGQGIQPLGDLAGGGFASAAFDITDDGSIFVGYGTSDTGQEGCIWTNGVPQGVGAFPSDEPSATLFGVTAIGTIAVGSSFVDPFTEAAIWRDGVGLEHFQTVLTNEFGVDTSGWILFEARAISANGRAIVGQGLNPQNVIEAFLVRFPNPCPGDINGDYEVSIDDLTQLLSNYGAQSGASEADGDLDFDDDVDLSDLALLLSNFGALCA